MSIIIADNVPKVNFEKETYKQMMVTFVYKYVKNFLEQNFMLKYIYKNWSFIMIEEIGREVVKEK